MIEVIKNRIWEILKNKEVSLVLIYDRNGRILWHRGREIHGRTIDEGIGFCRSYIRQSLKRNTGVNSDDIVLGSGSKNLSNTAVILSVKSLIIQPINRELFLYVDSGSKEHFTTSDRTSFMLLGELLADLLQRIGEHEKEIDGIIGTSPAMEDIRQQVVKFSLEEEPVLLLGETGVGKSHIAELIHTYSGRKGTLVHAGAPNLQETLFESTLFGHKKGSFTDAKTDKKGLVQEAAGGTLFIDEIAEVPLRVQAKLLRFIESKKYRILGESTEREADVRIIAATNKNLESAIAEKEFREDLYYRLQVLEIFIPPLRERREDIEELARKHIHFLKGKETSPGFWEALISYGWPGNVRELLTVLKKAGILLDEPISGAMVKSIIHKTNETQTGTSRDDRLSEYWRLIEKGGNFWRVVWDPYIKREIDGTIVKEIVRRAYAQNDHNFKKTLTALNLPDDDYPRFIATLHKYKLHPGK